MNYNIDFLKKAAPTILTCIGSVGVIATAVLAVKETPKAMVRIHNAEKAKGEKLTFKETFTVCWRFYIPAGLTALATIGCIFGANALNMRQQAALISAYAFVERSYMEYKNGVKDIFGEEGHNKVIDHIMAEHPVVPPIYNSLTGEEFGFGETDDEQRLFYDVFSKRYFTATFSDVLLAELHTNRNFALGGEVSVKTFYDFLGLDTPDKMRDLYWFACDGYQFVDFGHSKHYIDDGVDMEPIECWSIEMIFEPTLECPNDW